MKAIIFEIKRFAVHDGDGIRTTVFLKGCPLQCVWCHNPEGILSKPQLAYLQHKCILCGECVATCPNGAHAIVDGKHVFYRNQCTTCGKCEEACLGNAITLYGKEYSVDELLPILLKDKDYYDHTGGGVTLSGGECLLYPDFCKELLKKLKEHGVNTAVDTCGFVTRESLDKVIPYTDAFLYDVKAFDTKSHQKCTGHGNETILENLLYLDKKGCKIEIRIPFVPKYNDDEIENIASMLSGLQNIVAVRLLPYHNYAGNKYQSLDQANTLPLHLPSKEELSKAIEILKSFGLNVKS